MATARYNFQKLGFNPANQKIRDFFDELHRLTKNAFRRAALAIIEQIIYAKVPPHLSKLANHLEKGTYGKVVTHFKKEIEQNGLETPDE